MHVRGKLGPFLGLPSHPKRDRDGTKANPSYLSDEIPDDEEGDTVSHWAIGNPKQVYLAILRSFEGFIQGVESDLCKGLGARVR